MHVIVNGSEEECGHEHEEGHHEHSHHHHISMSDIGEIVSKLNTSEKIKKQILDVYNMNS